MIILWLDRDRLEDFFSKFLRFLSLYEIWPRVKVRKRAESPNNEYIVLGCVVDHITIDSEI